MEYSDIDSPRVYASRGGQTFVSVSAPVAESISLDQPIFLPVAVFEEEKPIDVIPPEFRERFFEDELLCQFYSILFYFSFTVFSPFFEFLDLSFEFAAEPDHDPRVVLSGRNKLRQADDHAVPIYSNLTRLMQHPLLLKHVHNFTVELHRELSAMFKCDRFVLHDLVSPPTIASIASMLPVLPIHKIELPADVSLVRTKTVVFPFFDVKDVLQRYVFPCIPRYSEHTLCVS
jgi:hypothetical protein